MNLSDDDRAVSAVVGFVFIFAIVIALLAIYQASMVPSQNSNIEFNHYRGVQADFLDVRNTILTSDQTGNRGFVTMDFVVSYPARIVGVNAAPPNAEFETSEADPIIVKEGETNVSDTICAGGGTAQPRVLTYRPQYNYFGEAPSLVYENTVYYKQTEDGTVILETGQQLVQGGVVNLVPLTSDLYLSSGEATSVETVPGNVRTTEITEANISVPTQLSEEDWEALLEGDIDPGNVSVSNGYLSLTPGTIEVRCSQMGLNEAPPGGARSGAGVEINPVSPGDIRFDEARTGPNDNLVEADFTNLNEQNSTNITDARITFFSNENSPQGQDVGDVEIKNASTGSASALLVILGDRKSLDPEITMAANRTNTIYFQFTGSEKIEEGDWFVVDLTFTNGQTGTYFIAPRQP